MFPWACFCFELLNCSIRYVRARTSLSPCSARHDYIQAGKELSLSARWTRFVSYRTLRKASIDRFVKLVQEVRGFCDCYNKNVVGLWKFICIYLGWCSFLIVAFGSHGIARRVLYKYGEICHGASPLTQRYLRTGDLDNYICFHEGRQRHMYTAQIRLITWSPGQEADC